jgi:hypothetical protein
MALLPFVRWVVCGDTAIMHAAAGLGIKTYALFGPTSPVETGPYGSGHVVIAGKCPRRPCFRSDCAEGTCMKSIDPVTVYGCIRGDAVVNQGCDVFTTKFVAETYRLEPVSDAPTHPYFDEPEATLTRRAVEQVYTRTLTSEAASRVIGQSRRFVGQCREMEELLQAFLRDRTPESLRAFEQKHAEAVTSGEGITAFWAALLNIRLNSVPLLDPATGVTRSIDACRLTACQISQLFEG